ncbi:hypothetical protein BS47DRAFT_1352617 [Hydnum rufescens UP504]|uniref:Uncharacterized protein n=1 Tax=Hydnum rufescens UP504 TaxID=1448309 RepID=A0A9P6AIQ2_9AGAM|nr:hypothetical protein BS47DRAFT_1352617 [Hydnum rufescens UP504]
MFPLVFLAQTSDVTCWPEYDWAKNSRGQTPCTVAAILEAVAACNPKGILISSLSFQSYTMESFRVYNPSACPW